MKIAEILSHLESIAHPSLQESYDNAGLITGNAEWPCTGALVSLDATEAVLDEAISKGCNLVIAHHPIVFRGLKKITGANYVERVVIKAIKNDIALYAIHTNLDNVHTGVNAMMASRLGLQNTRILQPVKNLLKKLYVFVPHAQAEMVRNAIFAAGAGHIGNYSECSFNTTGEGSFKPGADTNPFSGEQGKQQREAETRIETVFPAWIEKKVIAAMLAAHPYEEVAYDVLTLENSFGMVGEGMIGQLPESLDENHFLTQIKKAFGLAVIRHTPLTGRPVRTVALCGGAGSFLISNAIAAGADFYISADIKYHEFFDADGKLVLADIGHFESEQFTIDLLMDILREKFPTFAALKTSVQTNPVQYFTGS